MDFTDILKAISTLGFPIAVTMWLLYERYYFRRLDNGNMSAALQKQTDILERLERILELEHSAK